MKRLENGEDLAMVKDLSEYGVFCFEITVEMSNGRRHTYMTEESSYAEIEEQSPDMQKMQVFLENMLRGRVESDGEDKPMSDNGLITLGQWKLRGDRMDAFRITLCFFDNDC